MRLNARISGPLAAVVALRIVAPVHADEHPTALLTAVPATQLSGYVDTSAQWNPGTGNAFPPAYKFGGPAKADGFNLDVVKLTLERPLDETQFAAGYKVDLLFGPDANAFASQSTGNLGDLAIKQAFIELLVPVENGLHLKFGVFDSVIGYETFEAPVDANFTRSWGHTMEPSTHTGMLASYAFTHNIAAAVGVADTLGPVINGRASAPFGAKAESYKTYLGSITLGAPEQWENLRGSTVALGVVNGFRNNLGADQTSWYAGATLATPVTNLVVGMAYDYTGVGAQSSAPLLSPAYANATAAYASWRFTDAVALHGRADYTTRSQNLVSPGLAGDLLSLTGTLQWDLWKNVLTRMELRWDHALDGTAPFGGAAVPAVPPPGGMRRNALLLAANLIYEF